MSFFKPAVSESISIFQNESAYKSTVAITEEHIL